MYNTASAEVDSMKFENKNPMQRHIKNRYFNLDMATNEYHKVLFKYQKAKYAVFTDMIENSMLDIIVVSNPQPQDSFN